MENFRKNAGESGGSAEGFEVDDDADPPGEETNPGIVDPSVHHAMLSLRRMQVRTEKRVSDIAELLRGKKLVPV